MQVNHVLSGGPSPIFKDILDRFDAFYSVNPQEGYDLYVYWRPHLVNDMLHPAIAWHHADLTDDCVSHSIQNIDIERFDHHICLCEKQAQTLNYHGISRDMIDVIHHAYDERLLDVVKSKSDKLRFGYFSRRYSRLVKGEEMLGEIMRRMQPVADEVAFYFAGDGRQVERDLGQMYGIESNLLAIGDYADIITAYADIDVMLVLSKAEGGPCSLPESVAAGCAVISRPCGMAPDIGIDMSDDEIFALVDAIVRKGPSNFKRSFFENWENTYLDRLTNWGQCIAKHRDVYKKVVDSYKE